MNSLINLPFYKLGPPKRVDLSNSTSKIQKTHASQSIHSSSLYPSPPIENLYKTNIHNLLDTVRKIASFETLLPNCLYYSLSSSSQIVSSSSPKMPGDEFDVIETVRTGRSHYFSSVSETIPSLKSIIISTLELTYDLHTKIPLLVVLQQLLIQDGRVFISHVKDGLVEIKSIDEILKQTKTVCELNEEALSIQLSLYNLSQNQILHLNHSGLQNLYTQIGESYDENKELYLALDSVVTIADLPSIFQRYPSIHGLVLSDVPINTQEKDFFSDP